MNNDKTKRCGYVGIVGRPNVGKSTLLNHILGQKIMITSRKPQTTRHNLVGIKTIEHTQMIFVDTPGIHQGVNKGLNKYMNKQAYSVLHDVNVIVWVIEALRWHAEDALILRALEHVSAPVILAVNKVDLVSEKKELLPYIEEMSDKYAFHKIIPISAKNSIQLDELENDICALLPKQPHVFDEDEITDRSKAFLATEIIREKLMRQLGQELPYAITVTLDSLVEEKKIIKIAGVIWVEKDSQKSIVIGKQGRVLKEVGTKARIDMEKLFDIKVFLQLWVKVKEGWSDDVSSLKRFGYSDDN